MNIKTIVTGSREHRGSSRWVALVAVMLLGTASLHAQEEQKVAISREARAYFEALATKRDTAEMKLVNYWRRDRFIKRFSIHTNLIDWATLVPNLGIEMDLKQTTRTNWSIMATGKFNGSHPHGKIRYDVAGIRLEGRHYWRTGKWGKKVTYHDSYVKLITNKHDTLGYNADSLSSKFYNRMQKIRRNVFSGRTLDNPRNWRAYYVGAWAAYDDWNVALRGKGRDGRGLGIGFLAGWTVPLLPQRYPKEGSLDLDLGAHIGVKAVKYDAWNWEEATREAVLDNAKSKTSWSIVPFPVVQDIHVSLVWRFRGIKSKVDRTLIDDYEKKIAKYQDRLDRHNAIQDSVQALRQHAKDSLTVRNAFVADSTSYWDQYNRRRLENALLINPDTTFTGSNYNLYLKTIKGVNPTEENLKKLNKEAAKKAKAEAEEQKKAAKKAAQQAAEEQKKAAAEAKKAAKAAAKKNDEKTANE